MKNNFLKYFRLNLKRSIKTALMYAIILSLVYLIPLIVMRSMNPIYANKDLITISSTNVGLIITALCLIAYISPVKQANYLMSKKSLDNCYSLPISRRNIMIAKVLTGIIETLVPFTLIYIIGAFILEAKFPFLYTSYMIPLYFILLISFLSLYILNFFLVSRANKIFDGVMFMILGNFAIFVVLYCFIQTFEDYELIRDIATPFIPFYGFISYGNYFNYFMKTCFNMKTGEIYYLHESYDVFNLMPLFVIVQLGILSGLGLWFFFKKDRPERAEEVSNSFFGYRVLNPLYTATFLTTTLAMNFSDIPSVLMITATGLIIYLILTIAYQRNFKISGKQWLIFGIILTASIMFATVIAINYYRVFILN